MLKKAQALLEKVRKAPGAREIRVSRGEEILWNVEGKVGK
jgi:hypothetical protein